MSIQAVSNVSIFQEIQNFYQDRRTDIRQLGSALQSGDLNKAQQVFGILVALGQSGPFGNAEPFANTSRAQAFEAVGQALQSGDLAGAQAAFASLQQTQGNDNSNAQHLPAFIVEISATQNSAGIDAAAESIFRQRQDFRQHRKTDIQQLGQALDSGNLDAAQQAFDALTALGQNGPFRNSEPFQRADRAQDFAAIGLALQSGDLAGAKQAFTDLANTFGHPHQVPPGPPNLLPPPTSLPPISTLPPPTLPPGPPTLLPPPTTLPPQAQPPSTSGGGSTAPSGSTSELVVNLPNPYQGSGGHLTVDVSQQSNGAGEQVALNFNPGSTNYQLVVNLFDNGASSSTQGSSLSLQA